MDSVISIEAAQIAQSLAQLPGEFTLSVTSRHYPRMWAADRESGFRQVRHSIKCDGSTRSVPELPSDADDVVITIHGAVEARSEHDEIKKTINELIGGSDFASRWEFRSSFGEAAAAAESRYEFMIYNAT